MWGMLVGPVADLIKTTINKIWGDKMPEAEKARIAQELQLAIMQFDASQIEQEYRDRSSARDLAKADVEKGNWFTNVLAATIRPTFGFIVIGAFIYTFVAPYIPGAPQVAINEIQKEIMLTVIYFYFGGRTIERGMKVWADMKKEISK